MKLEMQSRSYVMPQPQMPPDEYVASRNGDENSFRALQVAQMNKDQEAWTRAQAPNVFKETVE